MQQKLLAQASLEGGGSGLAVIETASPYVISLPAWKMAREITDSIAQPFTLEGVAGLPEWFELDTGVGYICVLLYTARDKVGLQIAYCSHTEGDWSAYVKASVQNGRIVLYRLPPDDPGRPDIVTILNTLATLTELIRHPTAVVKTHHPVKPLKHGAKAACRSHRPAFTSVDVHLSREEGRARSPLEGTGSKRRFHHVRPFARVRLGKPELVCGHWRGDSTRGVMVPQHYRVVP